MRKILLSFMMLLASNVVLFAQSIPVTFETGITIGDNWKADSGLGSVEVVTDPVASGHGLVGKITSSVSGQAWQNAQLLMTSNYIDLTTTKTITFDHFSTVAGGGLLKLEQALNGGSNVEVAFTTSGTGWESISVDFTSVGANDQYKLLVFFPGIGNGTPNTDEVTYIDNVTGVVGDVATPPSVITLPIDFESVPKTSDFNDFDGGAATVIDNPHGTGKVAKIVRNGGQIWAGSWIKLNANLDFSSETIISMKVYTDAPVGTTIALKIEGGTQKELSTTTTVSGAWEIISWDFAGATSDNFKLTFLFDLGIVGDGSAASTFLFDDIVKSASIPTAVAKTSASALGFYPNPATDLLYIKGIEEGVSVEVYSSAGNLVKTVPAISGSISVSDLSKGVYFVKVNGTTSKIIKK